MKILHCCLSAIYADGFGYQENIMPKIHQLQDNNVMIVASTEVMDRTKGLVYTNPSSYITEDGIPIVRLPYVSYLPHKLVRKLRIYNGLSKLLEEFAPDIIFMHDAQTFAVFQIISYLKRHPKVRLYVDSHTDFVNSARNWISKNILHGIIYKTLVRYTIPYVTRYYGTLPARVHFYSDFYGTPKEKTEFLPMGIDDVSIDFSGRDFYRQQIRSKLKINKDDFVLITGGKIDKQKNTHILLQAFSKIQNEHLKLILFGSISASIKDEIEHYIRHDSRIIYIGWISSKETYKYFFASDLACFLGTHSTLWEETVGYGIPAIFKEWKGITHVDRRGNCILIKNIDCHIVYEILFDIIYNDETYSSLKNKALSSDVMQFFFYSRISKYAIENL